MCSTDRHRELLLKWGWVELFLFKAFQSSPTFSWWVLCCFVKANEETIKMTLLMLISGENVWFLEKLFDLFTLYEIWSLDANRWRQLQRGHCLWPLLNRPTCYTTSPLQRGWHKYINEAWWYQRTGSLLKSVKIKSLEIHEIFLPILDFAILHDIALHFWSWQNLKFLKPPWNCKLHS